MQTANGEQEVEDEVRDQQHQSNQHGKEDHVRNIVRLSVIVIRDHQAISCQQCDTKSDDRINCDPNLHPPELRTGNAAISVETARKRELDGLEKSYHYDLRILNDSDIAQPLKRLWALLRSYRALTVVTFVVATVQRRQQVRSVLRPEEQIALEQLRQEQEQMGLGQQGPGLEQLVAH